jgi:hypothetical protein
VRMLDDHLVVWEPASEGPALASFVVIVAGHRFIVTVEGVE